MFSILYTSLDAEGKVIPKLFGCVKLEQDAILFVNWFNENPGVHFNGIDDETANSYTYCKIHNLHDVSVFDANKLPQFLKEKIVEFNKEKLVITAYNKTIVI